MGPLKWWWWPFWPLPARLLGRLKNTADWLLQCNQRIIDITANCSGLALLFSSVSSSASVYWPLFISCGEVDGSDALFLASQTFYAHICLFGGCFSASFIHKMHRFHLWCFYFIATLFLLFPPNLRACNSRAFLCLLHFICIWKSAVILSSFPLLILLLFKDFVVALLFLLLLFCFAFWEFDDTGNCLFAQQVIHCFLFSPTPLFVLKIVALFLPSFSLAFALGQSVFADCLSCLRCLVVGPVFCCCLLGDLGTNQHFNNKKKWQPVHRSHFGGTENCCCGEPSSPHWDTSAHSI